MIGDYNKNNVPVSAYQPSREVEELTADVQKDYHEGVRILQRPWTELNDRSVIEDENRGQMMFNAFVDTSVEDPNEGWKWRGTRSMARNKGIAMHANLTATYLLPLFVAQNQQDETDQDFSEIMRDIIEWMAQPTNSNYQESFLQVVFGMLQNPVTYLGAEYLQVYQTIKEKIKDGYAEKEVIDEVLSGFRAPVWSSTQVLITNAYERNIQKQRCIIKRRYVEKAELEALYGQHENWSYLDEGVKSIYNDEEGLFYDVKDDDHPHLVAEETYLNRREDMEVCFINGIYFGTSKVSDNAIKHRDNYNAPKYNVVPFGYSRIGNHFFYYKSMMNVLGWDNMLYDVQNEIYMNRATLEAEMPYAVSGSDKVDSEIIFPNAVVAFEDKDTKLTPLLPQSNLAPLGNAIAMTEKSMQESSVNETISGQLPEASQKAYTVAQAQANAKRLIGNVAKSLAESIIKYGDLMKDIAINHLTVPMVDEMTSGKMKIRYRTFLLKNKESKSRMGGKKIKFDESLIGLSLSPQQKVERELAMLEEVGYPTSGDSLYRVNPELFAKFKYLCYVDVEEMFTKNNEYWQPMLMQLKSMLAADPTVKQDVLTRKLLYTFFQSEADDLMQDNVALGPLAGMPAPQTAAVPNSPYGQQVENRMLARNATNVVS